MSNNGKIPYIAFVSSVAHFPFVHGRPYLSENLPLKSHPFQPLPICKKVDNRPANQEVTMLAHIEKVAVF